MTRLEKWAIIELGLIGTTSVGAASAAITRAAGANQSVVCIAAEAAPTGMTVRMA
ncbi:hypothetical protein JYG34_09865 [Pseudomonas entomophila]|uniref:hypothetical protein n=1 Tax=Pseudomonas entomophila TaxID=312306 RepID=UPI001BCFACD4|nr:hypothetical protein [Pseudomonas entomophila]QVM93292.1 hypothetical protein JYG34_09865 [Pseudomonas entomophila]